ncbi:MAG TPA: hypothetical protein PKU96_02770 [bacterium]|nr:MAG: Alpha/beta hydrolase family protein [bacterium ADurb.Bin270]HPW45276.1 hypothetical protein [bacterium]
MQPKSLAGLYRPPFSPILPNFIHRIGGMATGAALDAAYFGLNAAASAYSSAGLNLTRIVSGLRETGMQKRETERISGRTPYFLTKRDHFIKSLDEKVDLLLGEISFDRIAASSSANDIERSEELPAIFFSHGMFMNANFGLFPIDGRGQIPNIDTLKTFLGFFAYLGFKVFYLHMRNCVQVQNRYVRNTSAYVTDPSARPDMRGVKYEIPPGTTFDVVKENDIGSALRYINVEMGYDKIVAIAHSLGGDMLYDYIGSKLPYSSKIAGFVPLCSPLRWKYPDEMLIRILLKVSKSADALNSFMEQAGVERRADPLGFVSERVRFASELLAGFSPLTEVAFKVSAQIPLLREALATLYYPGEDFAHINQRIIGKFIRKCLEPMPTPMIEHFMKILSSSDGSLTTSEGRPISAVLPNISIPVMAIAGGRDGLAKAEQNIEPEFKKIGSSSKKIHIVENGDHFTTVIGKDSPRTTWLEIASWLHKIGLYPEFDRNVVEKIISDHVDVEKRPPSFNWPHFDRARSNKNPASKQGRVSL